MLRAISHPVDLLELAAATTNKLAGDLAAPSERPPPPSGPDDESNGDRSDPQADQLLVIVVRSRQVREQLRKIELEAAKQARHRGVTIRQLAAAVGISERGAAERYRRTPGSQGRATP